MGVNHHTATLYYHKLRELIAVQLDRESPFERGEVEIGESYLGGHRKGKHGRGAAGKVSVFGLLNHCGRVYAATIPDTKRTTLLPIIRNRVVPDSVVYTAAYSLHDVLDVSEFRHFWINHSTMHVAAGHNHFNRIVSGAKPNAICVATMASRGRIFTCSSRSASGASTSVRRASASPC